VDVGAMAWETTMCAHMEVIESIPAEPATVVQMAMVMDGPVHTMVWVKL
jgi:hypothetical protein